MGDGRMVKQISAVGRPWEGFFLNGRMLCAYTSRDMTYSHIPALRNRLIKKPRRELSRAELRNRAVHCPRARNLALLSPELGLFGLLFGLVRWLRRPT